LPKEYYDVIRSISDGPVRGFGSIKVKVRVGNSNWNTSIFPDTKSSTYLLPIKKSIRKTESINIGDMVKINLVISDI
jgi:hypothetical protein